MMDWSDRHCRMFWRQLTRHSLLYTEMVTTGAILHAGPERFLSYHEDEHPIALQLGGSDPAALAECAAIAEEWGYDEVNLNCGCPSDRVQNGAFGACLMAEPERVADCVTAMKDACKLPVTVKHRIGIDELDSYEHLHRFAAAQVDAGCETLIVHARKAWLQGLSPKQNREIPPLHYDVVYRLKEDFPDTEIIINGGLQNLEDCYAQLEYVDGVMMGRSAYQDPYLLLGVDPMFYQQEAPAANAMSAVEQLLPYIEAALQDGAKLNHISRHMLGLFNGRRGAKQFRRHLSQNAYKAESGIEVLTQALAMVYDEAPSNFTASAR